MPTQAERTANTRARLLDATVECLDELGYAGTSTTEVSRRAGVSRGAQLHHFPTKHELVAAAADHLFECRVAEFRALVGTLPEGPRRLDAAIDLLWSFFQGPMYTAWFELTAASRTDPVLADHLRPVEEALGRRIGEAWVDLFPPPPGHVPNPLTYDIAPEFLFALLEGLAVRRLIPAASPQVPLSQRAQPNPERDGQAARVLAAVRYLAQIFPLYVPEEER